MQERLKVLVEEHLTKAFRVKENAEDEIEEIELVG